ncbi:hypothetical protein F5Y10DRAFT_263612 [Nemania abortiva]|nr:hypothetical protein F5Y10DRAFT_263612 [Nemania abortiva]
MARNLYEKKPVEVGKRRGARRMIEYEPQLLSKNRGLKREIQARNSAVNWKDEKVWENIRNQGCYHRSDEIIVSCGTVTINKAEGPCPKVLAVYNNRIGIYQLPKGRKDIGEEYLDAAIRETVEETGIAVRPLRLRFGSRSTPPRSATTKETTICSPEDPSTGVTRSLSNEVIGVNPDPATGAWRNIHWYAAKPCDGTERDEACMPIPDDRDKFSTFWFSETEALARLKLDDEKFMVRVAFEYTRNMSTDDWLSNERLEGRGVEAVVAGDQKQARWEASRQTGVKARCSVRAEDIPFDLIGKSQRPVSYDVTSVSMKLGQDTPISSRAFVICRGTWRENKHEGW